MLYRLRVRGVRFDNPLSVEANGGVSETLIEASDALVADWRGRKLCEEHGWKFVQCIPAVVADEKSHPMPKVEQERKAARVGA